MAEFAYNNKVHTGTKVSPFKVNQGQDPRMGFEMRKKRKYKGVEKFAEKMRSVQEEAKAALQKVQENMKRYADKERGEVEEYRVGDLVLLSTKDLKYQCHKLHSTITPQILARFPRSKVCLKAFIRTFRTMPKMCQSDQYSLRYQLISAGH